MINPKYFQKFSILELLLITLPISFLFSNIVSEIFVFIIIFFYLFNIKKTELKKILTDKIFIVLFFLYLYLLINFTINYSKDPSALRSFFFIRFPIYAISLGYLLNRSFINEKKIFLFWVLILVVTCFDIQFQSINGKNFLGFEAVPQGDIFRLGGFMDQELKIAHFINNFFLITLGAFFYFNKINFKTSIIIIIFTFFVIYTVYLVGERSNFLTLISLSIIFLFFSKMRKFFLIFVLIIISLLAVNHSYVEKNSHSQRMIFNTIDIIKKDILTTNTMEHKGRGFLYKENKYFAHYSTAYQIFKDYPVFGVGLKNFRHYSGLDKYDDYVYPQYKGSNHTTHPHNLIFEIMSELGLVGLIIFFGSFIYIFFIFLKFAICKKNIFIFGNTIMLISFFIPFLPKGSFFTNWNAMIFWTVVGINLYLISQKPKKN